MTKSTVKICDCNKLPVDSTGEHQSLQSLADRIIEQTAKRVLDGLEKVTVRPSPGPSSIYRTPLHIFCGNVQRGRGPAPVPSYVLSPFRDGALEEVICSDQLLIAVLKLSDRERKILNLHLVHKMYRKGSASSPRQRSPQYCFP